MITSNVFQDLCLKFFNFLIERGFQVDLVTPEYFPPSAKGYYVTFSNNHIEFFVTLDLLDKIVITSIKDKNNSDLSIGLNELAVLYRGFQHSRRFEEEADVKLILEFYAELLQQNCSNLLAGDFSIISEIRSRRVRLNEEAVQKGIMIKPQ